MMIFFYRIKFLVEIGRVLHRQPLTQTLNLSQYLVVLLHKTFLFHRLHVLVDDTDSIVQQSNSRVLGAQVVGDDRLNLRIAARVLGDVVDADAFGLLGGQRVLQLDEQHCDVAIDDVNDGLEHAHGQVGVLAERVELEENGTLVYRAHLFVQDDVSFGWRVARRVPAEKVEIAEHLFDCFEEEKKNEEKIISLKNYLIIKDCCCGLEKELH